ncbi:hypothetical protein JJD41_11385 [Oxynema sp. CENA135]|nr:hypothetical protein [Oxynema sp. CENA135]
MNNSGDVSDGWQDCGRVLPVQLYQILGTIGKLYNIQAKFQAKISG